LLQLGRVLLHGPVPLNAAKPSFDGHRRGFRLAGARGKAPAQALQEACG
jgi:hypothetical protein